MMKFLTAFLLIFAMATPAMANRTGSDRGGAKAKEAVESLNKGVEALQAGDAASAVEYITIAIDSGTLEGDNLYAALFARGAAYSQLQQCNLAIPDFTGAIEIKQDDPQVYAQRGNCYVQLQQPAQAIPDLKAAVALAPQDKAYVEFLCATAFNAKIYAEAAPACEAAIALNPNEAQLYQATGQSYEAIGNKAKALEIWQRLAQLDPSNEAAKQGIARNS